MPRAARIVVPDTPHHVVQRGNRRQRTFFSAADYRLYLRIAAQVFATARAQVWAYCLMPNHVHLIVVPSDEVSLAKAVGATHVRYTRAINQREEWRGYLWQGRFASFPMDESYLLHCARYIGLNPVRAGLTRTAIDWPWSSVGAHIDGRADPLVTTAPLRDRLDASVRAFFDLDVPEEMRIGLRAACSTGRPLGTGDWIRSLERVSGRSLSPPRLGRPPGRPPKNGDTHSFLLASPNAPKPDAKECVSPLFAGLG
jgi:putative transposase